MKSLAHITIAFLHGYLAGKRNDEIVDVERLENATAVFLDQCIDSPADSAITTMESLLAE